MWVLMVLVVCAMCTAGSDRGPNHSWSETTIKPTGDLDSSPRRARAAAIKGAFAPQFGAFGELPTIESNRRLAILVPFRNCFQEMLQFVPHMYKFLERQNVRFHIYFILQSDNNRLNRASLINVGFIYTKEYYDLANDYIAIQDIDFLPIKYDFKYKYPAAGPLHIPNNHPSNIEHRQFIGGILLITREHYQLVNGMSNNYWGWGVADDAFFLRLKKANFKLKKPAGISASTVGLYKHIHSKSGCMRKCDRILPPAQPIGRDVTGLRDVKYILRVIHKLTLGNHMTFTVLDVDLKCDESLTPWCRCNQS